MELDFLSKFLQEVALGMAPVIAVALIGVLLALFKKLWAQAKEAMPQATDQLEWAATVAVKAAEQAGWVTLADEKKAYAVDIVEKWLASKGLSIDLDVIDAAVEAAVWDEFGSPEAKLAAKAK
jgi:hypothetical protein